MAKVKIGLVQMSCVKEAQPNLQKAIAGIKDAAAKGAQIICLQSYLPLCISAMLRIMKILKWLK